MILLLLHGETSPGWSPLEPSYWSIDRRRFFWLLQFSITRVSSLTGPRPLSLALSVSLPG